MACVAFWPVIKGFSPHFENVFFPLIISLLTSWPKSHLLCYVLSSPSDSSSCSSPLFLFLSCNTNFWQELGSLFYYWSHCECPHKSNVVMPLKHLLIPAIKHTLSHTNLSSYTYTLSHFFLKCMHNCVHRCDVWMRALWLFVLTSDTAVPMFVCNFHWLRSTPPNPWEFVDQHLLKKLLGIRVHNWAQRECNECSDVVIFMWYFWDILYSL